MKTALLFTLLFLSIILPTTCAESTNIVTFNKWQLHCNSGEFCDYIKLNSVKCVHDNDKWHCNFPILKFPYIIKYNVSVSLPNSYVEYTIDRCSSMKECDNTSKPPVWMFPTLVVSSLIFNLMLLFHCR